jgi:magnesium-transporting ATPase (P-type)
VPRRVIPNL